MDRYLAAAAGARPPAVRPTAQPYTAGRPTPQRRMKNTFARPSNWNPAPAVQLSIWMDLLFVPASRLQLRLADGESLLGVNSVRSAAMDYPTIYGSAIRSPATRKAPSIAGCLTWCVACPPPSMDGADDLPASSILTCGSSPALPVVLEGVFPGRMVLAPCNRHPGSPQMSTRPKCRLGQ